MSSFSDTFISSTKQNFKKIQGTEGIRDLVVTMSLTRSFNLQHMKELKKKKKKMKGGKTTQSPQTGNVWMQFRHLSY